MWTINIPIFWISYFTEIEFHLFQFVTITILKLRSILFI